MGSQNGDSGRNPSPPLWSGASQLAGRQWGAISRAQLRAMGVTRHTAGHRLRAGRLHRVQQGVYALWHTVLGREGRRLAAVLACGPGAALSHRTAATHWGLLRTDQTRIDVTAPRGRHGAPAIRLHRSTDVEPDIAVRRLRRLLA